MDEKSKIAKLFAVEIMNKMEYVLDQNNSLNNNQKFECIKELASLTSELLEDEEINEKMMEIAKSSKINGDNIDDKFATFKMIRNVINHFPIFKSWDDIYVSKELLSWNNPKNSQIERFFKSEKKMSYRIYLNEDNQWVEKVKIDINVPCLGKYNKIYLKDILSMDNTIWTFAAIDYYLQFLDLNIEQKRYLASI